MIPAFHGPLASMLSLVAMIVTFGLLAYVFFFVLRVKRLLWYQQKQLDILIAMATKSGVTEREVEEIINRQTP